MLELLKSLFLFLEPSDYTPPTIPEDQVSDDPDFDVPDEPAMKLVDMGMAVKWASCNLGASNPKDFGFYYMWGETSPATDRECSWKSYSLANGDDNKLTKYIPDSLASKYGDNDFFDNKRVLDPEDDAGLPERQKRR